MGRLWAFGFGLWEERSVAGGGNGERWWMRPDCSMVVVEGMKRLRKRGGKVFRVLKNEPGDAALGSFGGFLNINITYFL